jgi:predicted GNAT family acetyltransferase
MTQECFELELIEDPAAFLAAAEGYLRADPVLTTVVATVTQRARAEAGRGGHEPAGHPRWWALVRGADGAVTGVAMRTAPFEPFPLYVLPMPEAAARSLAATLHARGEAVAAVNGALEPTRALADETARLAGGVASVHEHMRLFELRELVEPVTPAPGRLRIATRDDLEVSLAWFTAFARDAAAQAGRPAEEAAGEQFDADDLRARIDHGQVWLWEDETGTVVHLTAYNLPAFGVVRVGPVYTPGAHRGRGLASTAVAAVSRDLLAAGHRVCLFTDQANPTSNKIYRALGYEPVVDMVNMVISPVG